jgi:hypothetical protein
MIIFSDNINELISFSSVAPGEYLDGILKLSRLGGVMVSVLAIGPKVCGFKTDRRDGFLR